MIPSWPEVQNEHLARPVEVLDVDGIVEAVLRVERREGALGDALLTVPGAARSGLHHGEGQDRDDEEDGHDPQDSSNEVRDQVTGAPLWLSMNSAGGGGAGAPPPGSPPPGGA